MTLIKYHFIRIYVKMHDKNDKCKIEHTTQMTAFNTNLLSADEQNVDLKTP